MNTAMLLTYGVPALVGVVSAVLGHWNGKRVARKSGQPAANSKPAMPALFHDPVVQLVLSKLVEQAKASGHAALDAAIVKLFPGLAPVVPVVNQVLDAVESKVASAGQKA